MTPAANYLDVTRDHSYARLPGATRTGSFGRYCSAIRCTHSRNKDRNLSFFTFPLDEARCKQWIELSGRSDLVTKSAQYCHKNLQLCSIHFESNQFVDSGRKRLVKNALPTLFEVSEPLERLMSPCVRRRLELPLPALKHQGLTAEEPCPADAEPFVSSEVRTAITSTPCGKKLDLAMNNVVAPRKTLRPRSGTARPLRRPVQAVRKAGNAFQTLKPSLPAEQYDLISTQVELFSGVARPKR